MRNCLQKTFVIKFYNKSFGGEDMSRQKIFVELMATLIDKQINLNDKILLSRTELESNCDKLSDEIGTRLAVDMNSGYEPCPFCCSHIDEPFDFVWVGINPGGVLNSWQDLNFSWQTTWQELTDFCVPRGEIRTDEKNCWQYLKRGNVESNYYRFFLRVLTALTTGEIYNKRGDLRKNYADVENFFIERFAQHSILNADLVPYKSTNIDFTAKNLLNDASYKNYFRRLIRFIEEESKPDAWIIFFGAREDVWQLLHEVAPDWNVPAQNDCIKIYGKQHKRANNFYLFARGRQKILLSPQINERSELIDCMGNLIDVLKNFERTLG